MIYSKSTDNWKDMNSSAESYLKTTGQIISNYDLDLTEMKELLAEYSDYKNQTLYEANVRIQNLIKSWSGKSKEVVNMLNQFATAFESFAQN